MGLLGLDSQDGAAWPGQSRWGCLAWTVKMGLLGLDSQDGAAWPGQSRWGCLAWTVKMGLLGLNERCKILKLDNGK